VEFLEVIIRPDEIKMEEKKMKGIVDWPMCIKDV